MAKRKCSIGSAMKTSQLASSREIPLISAMPALIWQLLFVYVPLVSMVGLSFIKNGTLTLEYYIALLGLPYFFIIVRSLSLALFTASVCVMLAYPVAYYLAFYVRRFKQLLLFFLILPFWINFLVQVYSWFFVLELSGPINTILLKLGVITAPIAMLNTTFAIYLVMVYCYVPFMIMPIYSALESFDIRLFEASSDLGATPWQTFMRVTLPISASGIKTGFFLVFIPSFGEFVIPALLGGGKYLYAGSLVSHYVLVARDTHMGASFTVVSSIVLLASAYSIHWFFKKAFGLGKGGV